MDDIYLSHHGIKGQKWGLRRFQNLDGSLTQEGRERYLKGMNSREKTDYLKSDDATRLKIEKYMDRGLSYSDAKSMVDRNRKDRNKKLLKYGAAAISAMLAAYGGYKLYKHLGNEADNARKFYKENTQALLDRIDASRKDMHTADGTVKGARSYWDKKDIEAYKALLKKQGDENIASVSRSSMLRDILGLNRFSKSDHDREWQQRYERQELESKAKARAELNRQIENQREKIEGYKKASDFKLSRISNDALRRQIEKDYDTAKYESLYSSADRERREKYDRMIEMGQSTLEELLKRRRSLN